MTTTRTHWRDCVTSLFAAALHGDSLAEHELRELALDDDRAADALCALAYVDGNDDAGQASAAEVAATDQVIAAVLESVGR